MIIPFDEIESIPVYQNCHWQYCKYKVCDNESLPLINEHTWLPNPLDLLSSIQVWYHVFYKFVDDDEAILEIPSVPGVTDIQIKSEPCEDGTFAAFLVFKEIEQAYQYAINFVDEQ